MRTKIILTKRAEKNLEKAPVHIKWKLQSWIDNIDTDGLIATRKISSYHDEPLLGQRKGERSIRLSRSYRAIYNVTCLETIELIEILEVMKHDY